MTAGSVGGGCTGSLHFAVATLSEDKEYECLRSVRHVCPGVGEGYDQSEDTLGVSAG
jgi:hypothetical protein